MFVGQIKWWGRTGRLRRWSRRSPRWWPSARGFPTWLLAPRCRSISPSYWALSATCWTHEPSCTSAWRNKGSRHLCLILGRAHRLLGQSYMTPWSHLLPASGGNRKNLHKSNAFCCTDYHQVHIICLQGFKGFTPKYYISLYVEIQLTLSSWDASEKSTLLQIQTLLIYLKEWFWEIEVHNVREDTSCCPAETHTPTVALKHRFTLQLIKSIILTRF